MRSQVKTRYRSEDTYLRPKAEAGELAKPNTLENYGWGSIIEDSSNLGFA